MISFDSEAAETIDEAMLRIGNAICSSNASGGPDAAGGHVTCLTSSIMGVTAGLVQIADAINNLAEAVRERD